MSKTFSITLLQELRQQTTHLATCMLVTRQDGAIYGFTSFDKKLTIGGVDYLPGSSFNTSDIESGNNLDTDNLSVGGVLSSYAITEDELRAGRWDYADFRIFQVNYNDLSMGDKKDRAGHLGEVSVNRTTFIAELLGMMEAYGTSIGEITQPACRANLGDARCKVNLAGSPNFTVSGVVDIMLSDFFTMSDSDRTEGNTYFDEGILTLHYDTGDIRYEVKAYITTGGSPATGGTWVTKTAVAYDATGVAYTMTRGCNRLLSTCRDVFNNVANFRGEPWLRGGDALVQIGRHGT